MKIHIVQKGDTLWKIAKKYGVDFETLKKTNTQLTNPDLIMPGMKIKVPSSSVHVKKNTGAGSAPPKEYVKEVQQKEFAATPTPLGIEDEEEAPYQSAPITQQPAMQQTQKEMQMKPQKEMPIQKEKPIQKEIPIQKPPAVEKPAVIEKPPVVEKVEKPVEKESTKFSVNILPQPPQPPIKPAKDYKISDVIKKGSELIAPQIINKMKPNNIVSPQTKKENVSNIVSPQTQKENVGNIVSPQTKKENVSNIVSPQTQKENVGNIVAPQTKKENVGNIVAPQTQKENVSNVVSPQVQKENVGNIVAPDVTKESLIIPQVTPPNIMPM
ncbi:SafA/ExsA family spore coat assembly protein, partial [Bacillus pseudomycoides]|uniref:SafA/ExsA family spore coat assembly protein n=1 Tax=Bacillus pseudomycoides TaxID=64104 RepID=UPI001155A9A2